MTEKIGNQKTASKREFLQVMAMAGAAALGGARFAGAAEADARYEVDPATYFDVIVIGGGTAGMPVAIWAAERGGKVLVIEKTSQIGGTLFLSGGQMSAAGTHLQKIKGIVDNPDRFYDDVMRIGHQKANPPVLRRYVDNAGATIDWLESLGLEVAASDPVKGLTHADFSVPRYVSPVGAGRSLRKIMMAPFLKAEASGKLRVLMSNSAKALVQGEDKTVSGVVVEDASGVRRQFRGKSVVLASGGCLMNKEIFEKYTGRPLYALKVFPQSLGDGLVLGVNAGGHVSGADKFIAHRGTILSDRTYPTRPFTSIATQLNIRNRLPWEIEVNVNGERFMAEDSEIDVAERAVTEQPGMVSCLVWDQEIFDKAPPLFLNLNKVEQEQAFAGHTMFAKGESLQAIATKLNLPADKLKETVTQYNTSVAKQSDPFGRRHLPMPIAKPPFYAVEYRGCPLYAHVGLDIDGDLRVLTEAGAPIPGLYGAGEVVGGWHTNGDVVVNGGSVTPAVTFGRYLGMTLPLQA
jgi:fumarate reductase flavoprotein subunit